MAIQPLSNRPQEISVTAAIEPAYERVKQILFRPFNLTKWIVIGFSAWLAGLGETGGGGGGGFNGGNHDFNGSGDAREQFRHFYHQAKEYVSANLDWIVPLAIFLAVAGLALWLVMLWISSRGKFMFLHCVALDKAEIEAPWVRHAGAANSLFRFRLIIGVAQLILILPVAVFFAINVIQMLLHGQADFAGIMTAIVLGLAILALALVFGIVHKFLVDFVVPIMFLRGGSCLDAWREFGRLLGAHFWQFVIYLLFQIVLKMAIGVLVLLAIIVTCCIAGCLMLLPFIGTVIMLPVLVFKRAYPLFYLAQFGPQFDVFSRPPMPSAEASPTPSPLAPVS